MKFIYPAVFRKTDKGTYKGFFPDLEDCFGEGDTLDEAIEEANAAAYNWISLELDEDDASFHRFLMKMIWILRRVTSSETFLSISDSMKDGMNKISSLAYFN